LIDVVDALSSDMARSGDQEFESLIGPLVEPGLRLAFSMLGNRAEAEDATQEAITRAWRALARLRDRSLVRPWFLAIVANQCRNVRRTNWFKTVRLPAFIQPGLLREPGVEKIDVERALTRLPMSERQVLFMRFYLDLPVQDIAVALGISPVAAKGRIYRACKRLRPELLEKDL
jgi:RNA polymerase sigma-70 factor (ECF subfamily)